MAQSTKKTIFQLWRAKLQQKRAYRIFNTVHSFNIEEKFQKNFAALKERLKKRMGPYSEEMKKLLENSSILAPEEQTFMMLALKDTWFASHVTTNIKEIMNSKKLCSPEELRRSGVVIDQLHTDQAEGHHDHVFFSLAPSDSASTVRFLDNYHDLIRINLERVRETDPTAFVGLWMSDHLHAYRQLQESEPVLIHGAKLQICYRWAYDEQTQRKEKIKQYIFTHPDGKIYTQTIKWGEEIFGHPQIEIALVLMTIEKLRLLGCKAWQTAMDLKNSKSIKNLIQTIFHSGVVELHKPAEFRVNRPGVLFVNRKSNYDFDSVNSSEKKEISEYIQRLFWGFEDDVLLKLKSNTLVNPNQLIPLGLAVINLFNAAVLSGSIKVVKYLIKRGVDAHIPSYFIGDEQIQTVDPAYLEERGAKKLAQNLEINCLVAALLLSDPKFINKKIIPNILSCEVNLNIDKTIPEKMLHLLTELGFPAFGEKEIRTCKYLTIYDFNLVMSFIKPDPQLMAKLIHKTLLSAENISLCLGVRSGSLELTNAMLDKGALPNTAMIPIQTNRKDWEHKETIEAGTTPLIQAIQMNREDMVQLLIKRKADVNRVFYAYNSIKKPESMKTLSISRSEGYTPLMLALSLGYKHKPIVKLLLESGANEGFEQPKQLNRSNTFSKGLDQNAKLGKYHRCYYMLTCKIKNKRYFVFLTNKHFDDYMELPVDSSPISQDFTAKDWLDSISRHWNLDLVYSKTTIHSLGRFRFVSDEPGVDSQGIKYAGVDYVTEILLIDLGSQSDELWKKAQYYGNHFKLLRCEEIRDLLDFYPDDERHLHFHWQGMIFNTFTGLLLASLTDNEDAIKDTQNKFAELQKAYEFYHENEPANIMMPALTSNSFDEMDSNLKTSSANLALRI